MKNINPTKTISWKKLKIHFNNFKKVNIHKLFKNDKYRFSKFSILFEDKILVDFSKNIIDKDILNDLFNLAKEVDLYSSIKSMFSGKIINKTENRAVLHTALRNISNKPIYLNNTNIMYEVNDVLKKMKYFSESIINKKWRGFTDKPIKNIVNIGIGGSNLGPYMVTEALKFYKNHIDIHYISNIDGTDIIEKLKFLDQENTLFIIASKTFTTDETLTNAKTAKSWFLKKGNESNIKNHFIAISSNINEVKKFGIDENNIFKLWDWVGGRYSLWSSIGLPIMISIGYNNFKKLLNGANSMDNHFYNTKIENNIPILLALISIWYNNFFKTETEAILPYDQYMHKFVNYLQQCGMESNGKNIDRNGKKINYQTGPIIWGDIGTNCQHSFYQLIHQGTKLIPCDFIAPSISLNNCNDHHIKLISNFFAQTRALAFGNNEYFIKNKFINSKKINKEMKFISTFKKINGNHPTNSILLKKITPYTLGALIALYEHKIFTQGVILNIFTFDQWGVELGKKLSSDIFNEIKLNKNVNKYDDSTNSMINIFKKWNVIN